MSIQIPAYNTTARATLGTSDQALRTGHKLLVAWGKIPTAASLGSTNILAEVSNTQGAILQLAVNSSGAALAKGKTDSGSGTASVAAGSALARDTWVLIGAAISDYSGGTIKAYTTQGGSVVTNSTSALGTSADTAEWNQISLGNNFGETSSFAEWQDKIAVVGLFDLPDMATCDTVFDQIFNSGGTPKAPNNIAAATPRWMASLQSDLVPEIGTNLTDDGVTVDGADNPTVDYPTPTNPTITAGPTAASIGETSYNVNVTADADCTFKVVIKAGHNATQPTQTEFDNSTITQAGTAATQAVIPVTGRTGNTQETIWVEADGLAGGTSDYGSANVTTTPAAPVITSVNGGNPIPRSATSVNVTGSGLTGHTACDIDGTTQSAFSVTNDTTATFDAVMPVGRRYAENATLNIGGTNHTVTFENDAGWNNREITNLWSTKADRIDAGQAWDLANTNVVDHGDHPNTVVDETGRVSQTTPTAFPWRVFDTSDNTWGAENTYTPNAGITLQHFTNESTFPTLTVTDQGNDNLALQHFTNVSTFGSLTLDGPVGEIAEELRGSSGGFVSFIPPEAFNNPVVEDFEKARVKRIQNDDAQVVALVQKILEAI